MPSIQVMLRTMVVSWAKKPYGATVASNLGGEMRVSIGRVVGVTLRAMTLAALVAGALGAFGCARRPAVSAEGLSLRRVVIYRNGVGYFERAGHIQADK